MTNLGDPESSNTLDPQDAEFAFDVREYIVSECRILCMKFIHLFFAVITKQLTDQPCIELRPMYTNALLSGKRNRVLRNFICVFFIFTSCIYIIPIYTPSSTTLNNDEYKRKVINYSYSNPLKIDRMIIASQIADSCYSKIAIEIRCQEIRSNLYDLYRFRRIREPHLEGKLIAEIVINSKGNILRTDLLCSTLKNDNFDTAMINEIRGNSFQPSYCIFDSLKILFPFIFTPFAYDTILKNEPKMKTIEN